MLGFLAVFIAVSNDEGRFSPADKHFIQALVLGSVLATVGAFIPPAMLQYFPTASSWFISLLIILLLTTIMAVRIIADHWNMPKDEAAKINIWWHVPPYSIAVIGYPIAIYSLFTQQLIREAYITSILLLLFMSIWCVVVIVFRKFF